MLRTAGSRPTFTFASAPVPHAGAARNGRAASGCLGAEASAIRRPPDRLSTDRSSLRSQGSRSTTIRMPSGGCQRIGNALEAPEASSDFCLRMPARSGAFIERDSDREAQRNRISPTARGTRRSPIADRRARTLSGCIRCRAPARIRRSRFPSPTAPECSCCHSRRCRSRA